MNAPSSIEMISQAHLDAFAVDLLKIAPLLPTEPEALQGSSAPPLTPEDLASLEAGLAALTDNLRQAAKDHLAEHQRRSPKSPLFRGVSLFGAIGRSQDETAYNRALAWVLDPQEQHQLGSAGLSTFLMSVPWPAGRPAWLEEESLKTSSVTVHPEFSLGKHGRADLLIMILPRDETTTRHILIEMKLGAGEGNDQLRRYERASLGSEPVLVFLTPDGRAPTSTKNPEKWIRMSFRHISWMLVQMACEHELHHAGPFLHTFARGVLEEVCHFAGGDTVDTIIACNNAALIESVVPHDPANALPAPIARPRPMDAALRDHG